MQVPEKKGKTSVSFRVTMMLTQVLTVARTCSEHFGCMGSLHNPMQRVLSLSHPLTTSQGVETSVAFLGPGKHPPVCLPAPPSSSAVSLPSHQQLCPLVRISWTGWPRVICAQGGGDITRSWTTDNDKEGRSGRCVLVTLYKGSVVGADPATPSLL